MLDGPPELIPVDEQSDDQVVHAFRFGKANRATNQTLDPRPQIDMLAFDFLHVRFIDLMLLRLDMPLVGTPAVGVIGSN